MSFFDKKQEVKSEIKPEIREYMEKEAGGGFSRKAVKEESTVKREPFINLENMYRHEALCNAGVNLYQRCIEEADFTVAAEGKEKRILDEILYETNFRDVYLRKAPLHLGIYGNCFIELIPNMAGEIGNYTTVDPKYMDFMRETISGGRVIFDEDGTPQGWVQRTYTIEANGKKKTSGPKPFSKDEMMHLTLFSVLDGEMGTGLIEPIYEDAQIKENIEYAMGQLIYSAGFPKPIISYGTVERGTNKQMKAIADTVGKDYVDPATKGVSKPYFIDLSFPKISSEYQNLHRSLYYLSSLQAAVMGIPTALLLMSGEEESRGALEQLTQFFEYSMAHMQRSLRVEDALRKTLISRGIKKPRFRFEWNKLLLTTQKEKIMRLRRLAQANLLKPDNSLEDWVRKLEHLPKGEQKHVE